MPAYCVPKLEAQAMTAWGETWDDALRRIDEIAKHANVEDPMRFVIAFKTEKEEYIRGYSTHISEESINNVLEHKRSLEQWAEVFPCSTGKHKYTTVSAMDSDNDKLRIQGFGALTYPKGGPKEWQTR